MGRTEYKSAIWGRSSTSSIPSINSTFIASHSSPPPPFPGLQYVLSVSTYRRDMRACWYMGEGFIVSRSLELIESASKVCWKAERWLWIKCFNMPADSTERCPCLKWQCQFYHSSVTLFFSLFIDIPLSSCARLASCQQLWQCVLQIGSKRNSNQVNPTVWSVNDLGRVVGAPLVMVAILLRFVVS